MIFTIGNETNNITLHAMLQDAEAVTNAEWFRDEAQLGGIAASWPMTRLVEIWNSLPGETPVRKFRDRATAVSRIWKAIQSLGGATAAAESETVVGGSVPAAGLAETISVSEDLAGDTTPPELANREAAEPAPDKPVAPQTPDVAPEAGTANARTDGVRSAPVAAISGEAIALRPRSPSSKASGTKDGCWFRSFTMTAVSQAPTWTGPR